MANRFSLSADIEPTVDERAAQREASDLAGTFEDELGDLGVGVDGGGVGGLGGARGGGGGGMGGAAAAGIGGRSIAGGAAAGGLAKVALGGAIGFGILQGVQTFASASPALQQTLGMFGEAMDIFFRPFGRETAKALGPFAKKAQEMAKNFNNAYSSDGLGIALLSLGGDVAKTWATGVASAIEDTFTGEADVSDLITIGASTWAASKIIGITSSSWASSKILSLTPSTWSAASLLSVGSLLTVGAAGLITVGTLLTLDAFELIDIGAAIQADWDDVVTLKGSVPFDIGEDIQQENPEVAEGVTGDTDDESDSGIFEQFPTGGFGLDFAQGFNEFLGGNAQGGLVRRPGMFMAGEAGPEAVMPLDDLSREMGRAVRQALNQSDTGGGQDMAAVTDQLQTVVRELQRTRQAIESQEMTVESTTSEKYDPF